MELKSAFTFPWIVFLCICKVNCQDKSNSSSLMNYSTLNSTTQKPSSLTSGSVNNSSSASTLTMSSTESSSNSSTTTNSAIVAENKIDSNLSNNVTLLDNNDTTTLSTSLTTTSSNVTTMTMTSSVASSIASGLNKIIKYCERNCYNNGECAKTSTSTDEYSCHCHDYFIGSFCSDLNLKYPSYDVHADGILFLWPEPFTLKNYTVLKLGVSTPNILHIEPLNTFENETTLKIGGLESDGREYIVCVVFNDLIANRSIEEIKTKFIDRLAGNCGFLVTAYDGLGPYTLAAFGVGGVMATCLIALAICRGGANCRQRLERETMLAKVMGKLQRLRGQSGKNHNDTELQSKSEDVVVHGVANRGFEEMTLPFQRTL